MITSKARPLTKKPRVINLRTGEVHRGHGRAGCGAGNYRSRFAGTFRPVTCEKCLRLDKTGDVWPQPMRHYTEEIKWLVFDFGAWQVSLGRVRNGGSWRASVIGLRGVIIKIGGSQSLTYRQIAWKLINYVNKGNS
jgi:hypothetical protein